MPEDRRIDTKETLENQHSSFDFRYVNCVPIETRSDAVGTWCVDWLSTLHCNIVVASGEAGFIHRGSLSLLASSPRCSFRRKQPN